MVHTRKLTLMVLALLSVLGLTLSLQAPKPETVRYEPTRPTSRCWYFQLEGELKLEPIQAELAKLATKDADCKLAMPPESSPKLKARHFLAVEAPAACDPKLIAACLEKGGRNATPLNILAVQSMDLLDTFALFNDDKRSAIELVLGLSSDLRWYRNHFTERQFFYSGNKLNCARISERFEKLLKEAAKRHSKQDTQMGVPAIGIIQWGLQSPIDAAAAERARGALAKLPGVRTASIDVEKALLRMEVAVDGVPSSNGIRLTPKEEREAARLKLDEKAMRLITRMRFDTWPIFEVLDKEQLALKAPEPAK